MKRTLCTLLCLLTALLLSGCAVNAEERLGEAEGYGGKLRVSVSMDGGRIAAITVVEHHETEGVGTLAIEQLPDAMVRANSTNVDNVAGATYTSAAMKLAVQDAMSPAAAAESIGQHGFMLPELLPPGTRSGVGMAVTGRLGPGSDDNGEPIYSLNAVFAAALFDSEGRILHLDVDQLELASPNASGMNIFSGWPGDDSQDERLLDEPQTWQTKRRMGRSYMMTSGSWAEEMDAYQRLFTGMTVSEIDQWYAANCSDTTGKPLTNDMTGADREKLIALDDAARAALLDVTSTATMSLRGTHGDILTAIRRAWENASAGV